jgi:hypothetical protein
MVQPHSLQSVELGLPVLSELRSLKALHLFVSVPISMSCSMVRVCSGVRLHGFVVITVKAFFTSWPSLTGRRKRPHIPVVIVLYQTHCSPIFLAIFWPPSLM